MVNVCYNVIGGKFMVIDEKTKKELLTWNDKEAIYKQFEQKCETLSKITNLEIMPEDYQLQYELHESSMDSYKTLQKELYGELYEKYPNIEFGMAGRLKSRYSHYEKVIRKFVEEIEKDDIKIVEILDDYAIKIFILYVNYPIDKVSFDTEGIYVNSDADEFRLDDGDCFEFKQGDKIYKIPVLADCANVWCENSTPYIRANINDEEVTLPLSDATTYKKSAKNYLVNYCKDFQDDVEAFYISKGFKTKKRKDYISNPKPSGYASRQCSFYSEEEDLGIECQIRTYDMEQFNNQEREYGYKPSEHELSGNSINKVPHFVLTTRVENGYANYAMSDEECFEYIYGISFQEYRKQMRAQITLKKDDKKNTHVDNDIER
jgi:hypothetical protein